MCDCAARLDALEQRVKKLEGKKGVAPGEFEQFWACYPRRVGKLAAQKAFRNAQDRPRIDVLLQAIERAKVSEDWRKEGGKYIPLPTTYLNQGRWDDEPVQIAPVIPKAHAPAERRPVVRQEYSDPPPEFWEKVGRIGKSM